jgi:hypothetical protein
MNKCKVKVWDGIITPSDDLEIQNMIEAYIREGWTLQSVTPQLEEGNTVNTVFIFTR